MVELSSIRLTVGIHPRVSQQSRPREGNGLVFSPVHGLSHAHQSRRPAKRLPATRLRWDGPRRLTRLSDCDRDMKGESRGNLWARTDPELGGAALCWWCLSFSFAHPILFSVFSNPHSPAASTSLKEDKLQHVGDGHGHLSRTQIINSPMDCSVGGRTRRKGLAAANMETSATLHFFSRLYIWHETIFEGYPSEPI